MLKIEYQGQFKRDYKLALKRGCNPELLTEVISILANEQELPENTGTIVLRTPGTIKMCESAIYSLIGYLSIR